MLTLRVLVRAHANAQEEGKRVGRHPITFLVLWLHPSKCPVHYLVDGPNPQKASGVQVPEVDAVNARPNHSATNSTTLMECSAPSRGQHSHHIGLGHRYCTIAAVPRLSGVSPAAIEQHWGAQFPTRATRHSVLAYAELGRTA